MNELKELPKGWKWVKLGDICKTTSGGTPNRGNKGYYIGNIPWVKSGELDKGLILDTEEKISDEAIKNSSAKVFPKGTLLIALYGATIGKLAFLGVDAATNQAICGIYENDKLDSKYIYNYLFHKKQELVNQGIGGAQPNISQTILKNLNIPLPPLPTQQAIVSKIEELFSELDKGVENLKTAQQQLKVYRQAVLKWAFEGKLTNSLNYDSNDISDEYDLAMVAEPNAVYQSAKNQENHSNQKNQGSDNGGLPEGWKWVKISDLCKVVRGGSPRPAGDPKYYDGNIPFLKVADLTKDNGMFLTTFNYTIKEAGLHKTRQIKPNTLLLSNSGATLGVPKICLINATMNDGVAAFLDLDERSIQYLYYFWVGKTIELRNINMGAGQPNLNTDLIKDYKVPFCSFKEQTQIVQEIESRLSVAEKMEESIQQSLLQAESLRQSILKKAFEGGLVK
jgi:type I restriction enzyme S subunit